MEEPLSAAAPASLSELIFALEGNAHFLSIGNEALSKIALLAAKDVFDYGISLEPLSHPHLHPFLASIAEEPAITLRSSTKPKSTPPPPPDPEDILPYTPLSGLTIDGLDAEQIWQQLELRNSGIVKVIGEVGEGVEDEDEILGPESEEEEGSDEEMTLEEFEEMMAERGEGSESDDSEEDSDEEDGDSDEEAFALRGMGSDEEDLDLNEEDEEDDDEEDQDDEDDDEEEDEGDEDEGDGDELDLDGGDDDLDSLGSDIESDEADLPGPSRPKQHETLDDGFFSIDAFNRDTEAAEAGRISSGRLGGEDDDEEIEDVSQAMLSGVNEDEPLMYGDFFDPPKGGPVPTKKDGKKTTKKGKGKAVKFAPEEEEEEEDAGQGVMSRVKGDLFDSDDEEEEEKNLSTHEKHQIALKEQIAELEAQAIGPKDWTLLGEASSRARPENSLLEENLDFEHAGKVVPTITEETVKSLEDLIKKRILDNNFDSTIRVRAYEPTAFLPSRYLELQDTQSAKSLAQIYEEEYQAAASGTKIKDPRDEKLKKEHGEIEKLWEEVCYKLDALSSLNFVPKQPKAQITTIDNLPTTSMESALPPTSAASTLLAPEELFARPNASSLVARSELTPEEKQKQRGKARKAKAAQRKALGDMAELYGKKKSVKEQKDEALKGLVKTGKGVTVVGKGGKEVEKARKRQAEDAVPQDSKRLKL